MLTFDPTGKGSIDYKCIEHVVTTHVQLLSGWWLEASQRNTVSRMLTGFLGHGMESGEQGPEREDTRFGAACIVHIREP